METSTMSSIQHDSNITTNGTNWTENQGFPIRERPGHSIELYNQFLSSISILIIFISFLCVASNILVFTLIFLNKYLQTTTNALVSSFSAADLLYSALMIPNYAMKVMGQRDPECFLDTIFPILCSLASAWSLFGISMDRYLSVILPLRYTSNIGRKTVVFMIIFSWTLSIGTTLGIFIPQVQVDDRMYIYRCVQYFYPTTCYFLVYAGLIIFPIVGTLFLHCCIIRIARNAVKKDTIIVIQNGEKLTTIRKTSTTGIAAKSTRLFLCIALIFTLVWLPLITITLVNTFCEPCRTVEVLYLKVLAELLYAVALLVNPWIYTLRNLDFRRALKNLWCMKKCLNDIPSISSVSPSDMIMSKKRSTQFTCKTGVHIE